MNGRKTLRCRAAVVGLALLMGVSFMGCHAGPRFFAKKDRDERAAKKEFADKGKFINKKKVRPESDYLKDDSLSEERIAKNDSKNKAKSKSGNADRFQNADELDRTVAARKRFDDNGDENAPVAKSSANKKLANKETTKSDLARRDAIRRPASKEVADSLFDEPLPEKKTEKKTITRPPIKSSVAAKNRNIDEDPFKNSVVNQFENKRAADKVATVNFNELEDDDDDESDDDDELEMPARVVKSNSQAAKKTVDQRTAAAATDAKRKFLPEDDVDNTKSSAIAARRKAEQVEEPVTRTAQQIARSANKVRSGIDNSVSKNRQQTQETLNDWRRELDQAAATDDETPVMNTAAAPTSERTLPSQNSGHISQTTLDEFAPNKKSQGAVLNGDLILDTTSVPTRFQRTESSGSGNNTGRSNASDPNSRTRPNSGASIDIVPGSTQNRSRPAGQIMLQSLSDHDEETSQVEQAVYEQSSSAEASEGLLPLLMPLGNDSDTVSYVGSNEATDIASTSAVNGPRLMPLDDHVGIQQTSESNTVPNNAVQKTEERTNSAFGWGTLTLVLGGLAAAVLTGLGLRRRNEVLVPVPVRVRTPEPTRVDSPYDPTTWPRG